MYSTASVSPAFTPFWQVVDEHYNEFERVYSQRYEKTYGFWRLVIGDVVGKFLACGDLREGFARVRGKDCGDEYFKEIFQAVLDRPDAVPGMIATVQTFGDLAHWHPHVHTVVTDGLFAEDGTCRSCRLSRFSSYGNSDDSLCW